MTRSSLPWLSLALALGCSSTDEASSAGSGPSDPTSTTDEGGGTFGDSQSGSGQGTGADPSTTSGGTGADTGAAEEDEGGFVLTPDGGGASECDPKAQDCPDGQKCTAWANDGGTFWNANRCVEISGTGVVGDTCMVEGSGVGGIDDCDVGHLCMNSDEEGLGVCVQFCQGSNEDCEPGSVCAIYNDGVLPICLLGCDPLQQDCPDGQACIDTPNSSFICFNDASGAAGADGDPCPPEHGENSCDPGMWCGPNSTGCLDVNCCTPYCDLSGAETCPEPDACVSFFGEGNAPPGFEDVGVCVLP
jgi:hypothetical protein